MEGNPYSRIVSVMRGETGEQTTVGETAAAGLGAVPAKMRMGTVSQRAPLKIKVAGIELPTGALRISEHLTAGSNLAVGDQVLMLTEDDQIFYILMKVVDAV